MDHGVVATRPQCGRKDHLCHDPVGLQLEIDGRTRVDQEEKESGPGSGRLFGALGPAAICIVGGLDLRLGWLPEIPPALQITGIAIGAAGAALTAWSMAANRFFYGVMRIDGEQGHNLNQGERQ